MMKIFKAAVVCFVLVGLMPACAEDETAMGPVKMPKKETTWVQTEKVRTTKEEVFSGKNRNPADLPVDENLVKKLQTVSSSGNRVQVTDHDTCVQRVAVLDKKRTTVQRSGGAWNAFERYPGLKPYSLNGMQLDSHINKMIFALNYLCRTAQGVPMRGKVAVVSENIAKKGKETVKEELFQLRENKAYVEKWIEYAELAKANETRVVSYEAIGTLVDHSEPLIGLYEDLFNRQVDDNSLPLFLSDAATLLHVLKQLVVTDPSMVMALREDTAAPYEDIHRGDM